MAFGLLFFLAIPVLFYLLPYIFSNISLKKAFMEAAEKCGLEFGQKSVLHRPSLSGNIHTISFDCRAFYKNPMSRSRITIIEIEARTAQRFPFFLLLSKETTLTRLQGFFGKKDIETGDAEFDKHMLIQGEEAGVVALLNKKVRSQINSIAYNAEEFELSEWNVKVQLRRSDETGETLAVKINTISSLIHELTKDSDVRTLAAYNIKHDPLVAVRKRNLELFISQFGESTQHIDDILLEALDDPSWEVSITAAPYCGEKGKEHLYHVIEHGLLQGKIKAIEVLASLRDSTSIPMLKELFNATSSVNLKKAILEAFTQSGNTGLNDFLIPLIESTEEPLRIEAVRALGTCGLLPAIEHLHEIVKQLLVNPALKTVAKESMKRIQARCAKGVEAGWLSIPDEKTDDGALSLTDNMTDEGALSLDEEKREEDL